MLEDRGFQITLGGLAVVLAVGSLARLSAAPRLAGGLIGVLALCELGWHGHSLLQVAPAGQFLGDDPVSAALVRLTPDSAGRGPVRNQGPR